MRIHEVYEKFMIPFNLQEHMLRVGSLAQMLVKHWGGDEIDKMAILQACLLHDIAKLMSFDLQKQSMYGMLSKDIDELGKLQDYLRSTYGSEEHVATVRMIKELGCSSETVEIIRNFRWQFVPDLLKKHDFESLLSIYCDMRIGVEGVLSVEERVYDLSIRNPKTNFKENLLNAKELEDFVFGFLPKRLKNVSDKEINGGFEDLLKLRLS